MTYVYVLAGPEDHRKVGFASDLNRRVAQIEPALPWPVELELTYWHPAAKRVENTVHKLLADCRCKGEWFKCSLDRINAALAMAAVCAEYKERNPQAKKLQKSKAVLHASRVQIALRDRLALLCDEYKERHGASEAEIARKLSYSTSKLNRLLSLETLIGFAEAGTISNFFNVSIAWLSGESEIRQPIPASLQTAIQDLLSSARGAA